LHQVELNNLKKEKKKKKGEGLKTGQPKYCLLSKKKRNWGKKIKENYLQDYNRCMLQRTV